MSEIEALQAEYDRNMAKYQRLGKPLLDYAVELHRQIMDLKREAGLLFYVEYMRYRSPYTEECEDLDEAKGYAEALEDNGDGVVQRIHGPGVDISEREWDDMK